MLHPAYASPPTAGRSLTPRSPSMPASASARRTLPDRNVSAATIEDAYVNFIFYCNPGLPLDVSTATLRENFQIPPRVGARASARTLCSS